MSQVALQPSDIVPLEQGWPAEKPDVEPQLPSRSDSETQNADTLVRQTSKRTFVDAVGVYGIFVTVAGLLVILASFCFLVTLWDQSFRIAGGAQIPNFWHSVLLKDWATRAVTICAVCIRIAVAAQAGLSMSMVASLICEWLGCHPAQLAEFSIIRSLSTGPQSLLLPLVANIHRPWQFVYIMVVLLYFLAALASQFTSTILLSDFGVIRIPDVANTSMRLYGILDLDGYDEYQSDNEIVVGTPRGELGGSIVNPWVTGLQSYPRFAEYAEPGTVGEWFSDTGRKFRAFLPLRANSDRSALRNYTGPATVVNSRVICVPPILSGVQFWNVSYDENAFLEEHTYILFDLTTPELDLSSLGVTLNPLSDEGYKSNCTLFKLPSSNPYFSESVNQWQTTICYPYNKGASLQEKIGSVPRLVYPSDSYLIINSTGYREDIRKLNGTNSVHSQGPWATLKRPGIPASVDITLCLINPEMGDYQISATAQGDFEEPELNAIVDLRPNNVTYDTSTARRMFGVDTNDVSLTPWDRGLLSLNEPSAWKLNQPASSSKIITRQTSYFVYKQIPGSLRGPASVIEYSDPGIRMSGLSALVEFNTIAHRVHAALFQDILEATRNPALALQALLTVLMGIVYYDFLRDFDTSANSTIIFSTDVSAPAGWRGITIVGTVLGIHLILFFLIFIAFLRKTDVSLLGNFWMGVSQIVSDDTMEMIRFAENKKDKEVEEWCKENETAGYVKIGLGVSGTGESQVRLRKLNSRTESGESEYVNDVFRAHL
ncbi:hypothetical protein ABW19_dt0206951 [Dactylella cylindrospora]|nr:hypothetical protein ABW19_dt0206951 [Dactylella cylindrospora]